MIIMMFNLMGRFSDIPMVCVGEVEVVEGGHFKFKIVTAKNYESYEAMTSYIVKKYLAVRRGSPQGFLFCNFHVNQGKVVMLDTVLSYDNYLKLFCTGHSEKSCS